MMKLFGLFRKPKELKNINTNDIKIKVKSADIIVSGTANKPYFEIKYYTLDNECHIGYSSHNLNFVFGWLKDCFEIVDTDTKEKNNMQKVKCISIRKLVPNQITIGKEYWLDEASKWEDKSGNIYAEIYNNKERKKSNRVGEMLVSHFEKCE